jgi:hypothetical protein
MLCAARAAFAPTHRFVIDLTANRLGPHGTKAAPLVACPCGTVLSTPTTTPLNRKTRHATQRHPFDAHAATPSRRGRAHAAGIVVAVASFHGLGALAFRRRSVAMDRPRGACAGGRLRDEEHINMVLQSRTIAKSAAAAMAMAAASANTTKPAAAKSVTPPRVLQSAHSPAQLCFFFKRG